MNWNPSDEVVELLDVASKRLLLPGVDLNCTPVMERGEIEKYLPHRDPFLFLDDMLYFDEEKGLAAGRYDLERGRFILAGHFPDAPLWPGIFQVEGINQVGGLLVNHAKKTEGGLGVLTNVLASRFMRKVTPGADLLIIAQVLDFGDMTEVVGQTLQNGQICSVAATRIYSLAEEG